MNIKNSTIDKKYLYEKNKNIVTYQSKLPDDNF